jgi:hypothetical protein
MNKLFERVKKLFGHEKIKQQNKKFFESVWSALRRFQHY